MRRPYIAVIALLMFLVPGARAQHTITTVAGEGAPNNVSALSVAFNPRGVARDSAGNLYVSDISHNLVYKVNSAGQLTTIAGNGVAGFSGDGGPATSARL